MCVAHPASPFSDLLGCLLGRRTEGLPRAVRSEEREEPDQQLSMVWRPSPLPGSQALVVPAGISSLRVSEEFLKQEARGVGVSGSESGRGPVPSGGPAAVPRLAEASPGSQGRWLPPIAAAPQATVTRGLSSRCPASAGAHPDVIKSINT